MKTLVLPLLVLLALPLSVEAAPVPQDGEVTLGNGPEVTFRGNTDPAGSVDPFEGKTTSSSRAQPGSGTTSFVERTRRGPSGNSGTGSSANSTPGGKPQARSTDSVERELEYADLVQREAAEHRRRHVDGLRRVAKEYGLPVRFDPCPDVTRPAIRVTSTYRAGHPAHGFDATDVSLKAAFHPSLGFWALVPFELHQVLEESERDERRTSLVLTDFDVSLSQMMAFAKRLSAVLGPEYDVIVEDPETGGPAMLAGVEGATWAPGKPMRTDYAFSAGAGGRPRYRARGGTTGRVIHVQLKRRLREDLLEALRRAAATSAPKNGGTAATLAPWPEWTEPVPPCNTPPKPARPAAKSPIVDGPDIGPRGDLIGGK